MTTSRIVAAHGGDHRMMRKLGVVVALRTMAKHIDGRTSPDEALEWALNVGYLQSFGGRGGPDELALTPAGERIVYAFWAMYQEGRAKRRAAGER